jgi:hypothetical protein
VAGAGRLETRSNALHLKASDSGLSFQNVAVIIKILVRYNRSPGAQSACRRRRIPFGFSTIWLLRFAPRLGTKRFRRYGKIMARSHTIIRNGQLIDPRRRETNSTYILIEGDTIVAIGAPGMDAPSDAVLVEASDRALMPGLVNGHVHGHGTLAKGLVGDRWPLELFLNAMPGITGDRTLEDKYLNGLIAAVEMIRKGCTACYDLFFEFPLPSRDGVMALGQAYRDAGVRAVIAPWSRTRPSIEPIRV